MPSDIQKQIEDQREALLDRQMGSKVVGGKVQRRLSSAAFKEQLAELKELQESYQSLDADAKMVFGDNFKKHLDKFATAHKRPINDAIQGVGELQKVMANSLKSTSAMIAGTKGFLTVKKRVAALRNELRLLKDAQTDAGKEKRIKLKIELAGLEQLSQLRDELTDAELAVLDKVGSVDELAKAMDGLEGSTRDALDMAKDEAAMMDSAAKGAEKFTDEVTGAAAALDLFGGKAGAAKREGKEFGEKALKANKRDVVLMGAAVIFATKHVGEMAVKFKDTNRDIAKFRVEAGAVARLAMVPGGAEELVHLRTELGMTTKQFEGMLDLMKDSSLVGVMSFGQMRQAALDLTATFGGGQLDRLKTYAELLKSIPTIKADLTIGANLDDRAEALFALAEKGQIQAVIDLQAAGLLGGQKVAQDKNAQVLSDIQKWEARTESIDLKLADFFGQAVPWMAGLTEIGAKSLGLLAAGPVIWLGVKGVLGAQKETREAVKRVEHAVLRAAKLPQTEMNKRLRVSDHYRQAREKGVGRLRSGYRSVVNPATEGIATRGKEIVESGFERGGLIGGGMRVLGGARMALGSGIGAGVGGGMAGAGATAATIAGPILAAVGPLALIAKFGEPAGHALKTWGERLAENEGAVTAFSASLTATGNHLEFVGKWWSEAFGDIGRGLGLLSKPRELSPAESRQFKERLKFGGKANKELRQTQKELLLFQESVNLVKNAASSLKMELADLEAQTAKTRVDQLGLMGGNVADFNQAMEAGTRSTIRRFEILNEGLRVAASRIENIQDPELRRAARIRLEKEELEGRAKLIAGIKETAGEFEKIPEILASNLAYNMRRAEIDVMMSTGGLVSPLAGLIDQFKSNLGNLVDSTKAFPGDIERTNAAVGAAIEDLQKDAESLRGRAKKAGLENVIKPSEAGKPIELDRQKMAEAQKQVAAEVVRKEAAVKALPALPEAGTKRLAEVEQELASLTEQLAEKTKRTMPVAAKAAGFDVDLKEREAKREEEIKQTKKAIANSKSMIAELRAAGGYGSAIENWEEERLKQEAKLAKLKSQEVAPHADHVAALDELDKRQGEINDLQKRSAILTSERAAITASLVALDASGEKDEASRLASGKAEYDRLLKLDKQVRDELALAKEREAILRGLSRAEQQIFLQREAAQKRTEAYIKLLSDTLVDLNKLVELVDNDPTVKLSQMRLDKAQAELDLAIARGQVDQELAGVMAQNRDKLVRQLAIAEDALAAVKLLAAGGEPMNQYLDQARQALQKAAEGAATALPGNAAMAGAKDQLTALYDTFADAVRENAAKPSEQNRAAMEKAAQAFAAKNNELLRVAEAEFEAAKKTPGVDPTKLTALDSYVQGLKALGTVVTTLPGGAESAVVQLGGKAAQLRKELLELGDNIEKMLGRRLEGVFAKAALAQQEYADKQLDLARFAGMTGAEAFGAAAKAAKAADKAYFEAARQTEVAARAAELLAANAKTPAERAKAEEELARVASARLDNELKRNQDIGNAIKKAADYQREFLASRQEVLDAEADYLSQIGAPFEKIFGIQRELVQLEAQRLAIAQQEFETKVKQQQLKEGTLEYEQAANSLRKQEIDLQKKIVGVQRDAMEKLLGKAFGALSDQAGRKFVMSEQRLLGVQNTRFQTKAGRLRGLQPGEGGRLENRAAKLGMAALHQGPAGVTGAGLGVAGKVEAALKAGADPAKETAKTAGEMADTLGKILGNLTLPLPVKLLGGIGALFGGGKGGAGQTAPPAAPPVPRPPELPMPPQGASKEEVEKWMEVKRAQYRRDTEQFNKTEAQPTSTAQQAKQEREQFAAEAGAAWRKRKGIPEPTKPRAAMGAQAGAVGTTLPGWEGFFAAHDAAMKLEKPESLTAMPVTARAAFGGIRRVGEERMAAAIGRGGAAAVGGRRLGVGRSGFGRGPGKLNNLGQSGFGRGPGKLGDIGKGTTGLHTGAPGQQVTMSARELRRSGFQPDALLDRYRGAQPTTTIQAPAAPGAGPVGQGFNGMDILSARQREQMNRTIQQFPASLPTMMPPRAPMGVPPPPVAAPGATAGLGREPSEMKLNVNLTGKITADEGYLVEQIKATVTTPGVSSQVVKNGGGAQTNTVGVMA